MALELIKVVGGQEFESFRNCFFNLAIPVVVLTEPAQVKKTMIRFLVPFISQTCVQHISLFHALKMSKRLSQRQHLLLHLGLLDHSGP